MNLNSHYPTALAREAEAAGLLTSTSMSKLLREAIRRRAGLALVAGAARGAKSGNSAMSMTAIQAEVKAARTVRRKAA